MYKCGKKLCGNLKRHLSVCDKLKMIKKRTSNMKIQCTYCNKSFLKSSMKKHVNRKHNRQISRKIDKRPLKEVFITYESLKLHNRSFTNKFDDIENIYVISKALIN